MVKVTDQLLQTIIERLVDALQPLEIYIFGSHSSGNANEHSDVDVFVVVNDNAGDTRELAIEGRSSLGGLGVPIDVIVYHQGEKQKWAPVKYSLPHEAIRKGRLVYAA